MILWLAIFLTLLLMSTIKMGLDRPVVSGARLLLTLDVCLTVGLYLIG